MTGRLSLMTDGPPFNFGFMTGPLWCELMTGPVSYKLDDTPWCEFDDRSRVSLMTGPGYCEFDDGPPLV